MTSVRFSPRADVQGSSPRLARAVPQAGAPARRPVDGFERKSVTAQALQRGMTGAAVTGLQQKLVAARFMPVADFKSGPGVYGPRTEAAVKRLQAHVGLPVTGIAGPTTLAALSSGARFQPEPEATAPVNLQAVRARLSQTFTEDVTQPMGIPLGA